MNSVVVVAGSVSDSKHDNNLTAVVDYSDCGGGGGGGGGGLLCVHVDTMKPGIYKAAKYSLIAMNK